MVLVDSSVWIAAWRGTSDDIAASLSTLVESGEARLNPLIQVELLQGARDNRHQDAIARLLHPIPILALSEEVWHDAPSLYLKCRKSGLALTTIDCLLASHAVSERIPMWSLDHIFTKIARHSPLKVYE